MKLLGAILLIGISTYLGFEFSSRLNKRPKIIRQLKSSLLILEAEILYSQTKLEDSFQVISKQIEEPTKALYRKLYKKMRGYQGDFSVLWNSLVSQLIRSTSLTKIEKEILINFGKTLGKYDISQQEKYIKVTINHLDRALEEAESRRKDLGNMSKTLGILFGIFLVILLF